MRKSIQSHAIALTIALGLVGGVSASETTQAAEPSSLPVGTCINMGNSLEPEQENGWGGQPITAEDFVRIKAAGFETIRLPVRWHNKSQSTPPYTIDEAWMARVTQVVDQALAAELNVILNSHHFDPIYDDPAGTAEWHGGVWRQIAERFADYPEDRLWFELENEPHNNFDHSNLLATLDPALQAVRATNPTRPVIYGGENWSGIDSLATLPLPDDANVYPTFHYYEPFGYSHQGASWVSPAPPPEGRRYGSEADRQRLIDDVAKVEAYVARTGKLPFMGETGAYDKHSSTQERAAYHQAVREAFAPAGVGICTWAYANTFPFWDSASGEWLPDMLEAMGLAPSPSQVQGSASGQAQPAASGPHPDLPESLHAVDAAVPGQLVNDPTRLDWDSYGKNLQVRGYADPSIPGGGAALEIDVRSAGEVFDAGLSVPLIVPVNRGETITIGFYARALKGEGRVFVRFQQNTEPYPGFGARTVTVSPDWDWHEVSATAERDLSTRDGIVALQFGSQKQKLEIGQTIVVKNATSIAGR
ncbi:MAG: cellulase family glycosylhydrolase [Pseudomonadota bacterium]